jgi:uncharacterized membrane protein YgcG
MDVAKVDRDVAYVTSVSEVCCKSLFKVFYLFKMYVASVLSKCCICCEHIACSKRFICFSRMMQQVFHVASADRTRVVGLGCGHRHDDEAQATQRRRGRCGGKSSGHHGRGERGRRGRGGSSAVVKEAGASLSSGVGSMRGKRSRRKWSMNPRRRSRVGAGIQALVSTVRKSKQQTLHYNRMVQ